MSKEIKYLTIDEQIEHLKEKGLLIPSKKLAKKYLSNIGYYKLINGYRKTFTFFYTIKNEEPIRKYYEKTSIDDLFHLYEFDQNIKNLFLKNISEIEVMIKARMSDVISSKYGIKETEYLTASNFKPDAVSPNSKDIKFKVIKQKILKIIKTQKTKHSAIEWYAENYHFYPFWVIDNVLPLGTISLLYSKMKQEDQYKISNTFKLKSKLFESMLMVMQLFRNACAHNEIVYNYKTFCSLSQKDIEFIYEQYKIEKEKSGRYRKGINDVFALIIIFKFLLTKEKFSEFIAQFESLINTLDKKFDKQNYLAILSTMGIVSNLDIIKKLDLKTNL